MILSELPKLFQELSHPSIKLIGQKGLSHLIFSNLSHFILYHRVCRKMANMLGLSTHHGLLVLIHEPQKVFWIPNQVKQICCFKTKLNRIIFWFVYAKRIRLLLLNVYAKFQNAFLVKFSVPRKFDFIKRYIHLSEHTHISIFY